MFSLQVEFVGEVGSDTGGLTQEFFRLFGKAMTQKYLENSTGTSGKPAYLGYILTISHLHGSDFIWKMVCITN